MGMFDYVRSSYPLPESFMSICQTKDIECDIGGTMTEYWIAPDGYLWSGNYTGTSTFVVFEEDDPRYDPRARWANHEFVPTGEHGKWRVHPLTKYVEVYPAEWSGEWSQWPRLQLHFKSGKLQDFQEVTEQ